jgi:hypothetical protein
MGMMRCLSRHLILSFPKLGADEMRITFMGSSIPGNLRKKQQMMSIFVEVGWAEASRCLDERGRMC